MADLNKCHFWELSDEFLHFFDDFGDSKIVKKLDGIAIMLWATQTPVIPCTAGTSEMVPKVKSLQHVCPWGIDLVSCPLNIVKTTKHCLSFFVYILLGDLE